MKKFIILTMVTMILLLVFVAGGLAEPEVKINEKIPVVPFTVPNYCTGEDVELSGTVHVNGRLPSGKFHLKCHLVGLGLTYETEYIANGTMNLQVEGGPSLFKGTGIIIITCISKGEEQNFILKARGCTILFVNGSVYFTFIEPEWECVE